MHIPESVLTAARISSGFLVSISCSSKLTPLFWKILSAPASSRPRTMRLFAAYMGGRKTRGQWHSPASRTSMGDPGGNHLLTDAADQLRPQQTNHPGAFRDQLCSAQEEWVTAWKEHLEGGRTSAEVQADPTFGILGDWATFPLSECSSPCSSFPHPPSRGGGEGNTGLCSLEHPLTSNSHFAKSRALLTFSRFSLSLFSSSRISNIFCTLESVEN